MVRKVELFRRAWLGMVSGVCVPSGLSLTKAIRFWARIPPRLTTTNLLRRPLQEFQHNKHSGDLPALKFKLPNHSSTMSNDVSELRHPEQGTQTHLGVLSGNITCVDESGTAEDFQGTFLLRNSTKRRSQILPGNFNGDFESAFKDAQGSGTKPRA